MYSFSEAQIASQFWASMKEFEIYPRYQFDLIMDGEKHRFALEGERCNDFNGSGVYFIHADEFPNWGIMDWHKHSEFQLFKFDINKLSDLERERLRIDEGEKLTPEEWRVIAERKEAERKRRDMAQQKKAFKKACEEYTGASEADAFEHPYLRERFIDRVKVLDSQLFRGALDYNFDLFDWVVWGQPYPNKFKRVVKPVDAFQCKRGDLLVPLSDALTGHFRTLQVIKAVKDATGKYAKRFYYGVPVKNVCYKIESPQSEEAPYVFLCEGISTGLAVKVLINKRVTIFCAMNCGNMEAVARSLRVRYPRKKIIIMADNDAATFQKKGFNPGLDTAKALLKNGLADSIKPAQITGRENENVDWYDVLATRIITERSK